MQRIIAYIYRYRGDSNVYRKCGNVGFCRVEEANDRRIINMCFKETHDVTKDCEIREVFLDKNVDKDMCTCIGGKMIRKDKICGGQMRLKLQGDKEDGLYIASGQEKYIVLWFGDKEGIMLLEKEKADEKIEAEKDFVVSENEDKQLLRAYNRMAKSPMIIENNMQQVVKLKPQQMIMLPRKYWRLTNNRFLMEGYYVHKHILFFKYGGCYVIGVPSFSWENQEENANKFGFKTVLEGADYGNPNTSKKYWLTYLN